MTTIISGPMAEPAKHGVFKSDFNKRGAHYNIYSVKDEDGMEALRQVFPEGVANELNFVLFSTSGVHGIYNTIEDAEDKTIDPEDHCDFITYLIIHPRIVCMRYGNCTPETKEDFDFLKRLRASSFEAMTKIGVDSREGIK